MTKASSSPQSDAAPADPDPDETPGVRERRQSDDVLMSAQLMTLSLLIRRGADLAYRREFGLGYNEWRIVSVVGFYGPLSHKRLGEVLGLDKGQISREVSGLVARQLLVRKRSHRLIEISLTGAGETVFHHLNARATERNLHFLRDLSAIDRRRLFVMLRKIRERATEVLQMEQEA
jgi:DNA-binding MarR family transcriptional regulator